MPHITGKILKDHLIGKNQVRVDDELFLVGDTSKFIDLGSNNEF